MVNHSPLDEYYDKLDRYEAMDIAEPLTTEQRWLIFWQWVRSRETRPIPLDEYNNFLRERKT